MSDEKIRTTGIYLETANGRVDLPWITYPPTSPHLRWLVDDRLTEARRDPGNEVESIYEPLTFCLPGSDHAKVCDSCDRFHADRLGELHIADGLDVMTARLCRECWTREDPNIGAPVVAASPA